MAGTPLVVADMIKLAETAKAMYDDGESIQDITSHLRWPGLTEKQQMAHAQEALRVAAFWPEDVLVAAVRYDAAWHSLFEGARDYDGRPEEILPTLREYLEAHSYWPPVSVWRRWAGRPSNNRLPGEGPGQESLFG